MISDIQIFVVVVVCVEEVVVGVEEVVKVPYTGCTTFAT